MSIARSFGPAAEQMKAALEKYSKDELIDLLSHIVRTYVVEGTLPLKPEVGTRTGDDPLTSLTFPQLVIHMQMQMDHREWQQFSVSGEDVWVHSGNQRLNLTARPATATGAMPAAQEPAPTPTPPPARAAAPAPSPIPPAPAPSPAPVGSSPPASASAPPAAQNPDDVDPFDTDVEASERFGMLEID